MQKEILVRPQTQIGQHFPVKLIYTNLFTPSNERQQPFSLSGHVNVNHRATIAGHARPAEWRSAVCAHAGCPRVADHAVVAGWLGVRPGPLLQHSQQQLSRLAYSGALSETLMLFWCFLLVFGQFFLQQKTELRGAQRHVCEI